MHHPSDDLWIEGQLVEAVGQETDLPLVELAQPFRRELLVTEEPEDLGAAVMAGGIVSRAREPCRAAPVLDLPAGFRIQVLELAVPAGDHGAHRGIGREAQKAVALA